ncbi:MAG: adenylate/guanylate cyclase domain-containing protein [Proteobacteria bacterium]|nr:adenylate/guanylate cyclase domain-containing protein [Pseudomonadota bacterium]
MKSWKPRLFALIASLLVLALAILVRASDSGMVAALRGSGFDTLQRIWPRELAEPAPVRVVDIDEASLKQLGQWPWSRSTLATLVNELTELGAAAVAFDIVFPEPDRLSPRLVLTQKPTADVLRSLAPSLDVSALPDNDALLADAIRGRPVVMAMAASGAEKPEDAVVKAGFAQTGAPAIEAPPRAAGVTSNIPMINLAATGIGSINIDLARDQGVARQIPMLLTDGQRFIPALVPETLRVAQGADTFLVHAASDTENAIDTLVVGDLEIPVSENGSFYVYYRPNSPDLYVSAASVVSGAERERLRPLIEGHVVYIGASAVGLLDTRTTALGETVPGVSIHAQATEQILTNTFLTRPEWAVGAEYIAVLLGGLVLSFLGALIKPSRTMLVFTGMALSVLAAVVFGFRGAGVLVDATFPLIALALVFLTAIAMRLLVTDRESRKLRSAFGQYVAPAVLAEIESNPAALKLGGEMRDVTVLFVDIENFTPLSEKLPPEILVRVVNRLLDACSKEILAEKGTIDKYIGDAVMAFWNAPVAQADHQMHAAKAGIGIRGAVARLNDDPQLAELLNKYGCPRLATRVGIASGPACVGNMGSEERFDYSVLGETVNVAARAEGACKHIGHDLVVAGDLHEATKKLATFPAGHVPMKGKSLPQPLEAIIGAEEMGSSPLFGELKSSLEAATKELLGHQKGRIPLALQSLLDELSAQHPNLAKYIAALPERLEDFKPAEQA